MAVNQPVFSGKRGDPFPENGKYPNMINSMTAYSQIERSMDNLVVGIEIRTYNSRHLDPMIRVPSWLAGLEEKIKGTIAKTLVRGRVELRLSVTDESEDRVAYEADLPKAAAYIEGLKSIRDTFDLPGEISMDLVLAAGNLLKPANNPVDLDRIWAAVEPVLADNLVEVKRMRQVEGDYLKKDFEDRLAFIEDRLEVISGMSAELLPIYRDKLMEKIRTLTNDVVEIDENRIAQEAAMMADRGDISEELVRARSHILQFGTIMEGPEAGGRKLNFLLQEFNREFNTMGSKAANTEIAHIVVDVKAELEKLREQVQNVE